MDELQATRQINISIDLLSAAKRHLNFLRAVHGLPYLHSGPFVTQAIRRYRDYWIPLAASCDVSEINKKNFLPPFDVRWVWHCHCLNPKAYQQFCKLHCSRIIDVPLFPDESTEVSARERCKKIWCEIYPNEPFDVQISQKHNPENFVKQDSHGEEGDLMAAVSQLSSFYTQVSQPYMYQDSFLKTAQERYRCFLHILRKSEGRVMCIPTSDILLMWQSHMVSPVAYAQDTEGICEFVGDQDLPFQRQQDAKSLQAFENTARIWETVFGHPYERAGAIYQRAHLVEPMSPLENVSERIPITVNWHHQDIDVNSKYSSLISRYVVEVCIQIRSTGNTEKFGEIGHLFVHLRTMEACKLLRLGKLIHEYIHDISWHELWLMQCEISSKGVVLELRSRLTGCHGAFGFSKLVGQATFTWKELEREEFLALEKPFALKKWAQMLHVNWKIGVSITPPVKASFLLKSLPDRVTDDAGAMLSKKSSKQQPQEGRWMSQTVLNHAGKECFIIRIRVATGVWGRKAERPVGVDWTDRIIHVHEGGWNYHSGSIGIAPDKIVATAAPAADELEKYKNKWSFSTGEIFTIQMPVDQVLEWERHLRFTVKGNPRGLVQLLNGRHMQYQVPSAVPEEEEGFVTLVRYHAKAQQGRATALLNWKLPAMEVLPEEDVVLVMLLCTATARTVADLGGKTLGMDFQSWRRRRTRKGSEQGQRDWGSVVVMRGGGGLQRALSSADDEVMVWYHNPEEVLKVNLSKAQDNEGVFPEAGKAQIYKGTSWQYAGGGTGVIYKMSSKGSLRNISSTAPDIGTTSADYGRLSTLLST